MFLLAPNLPTSMRAMVPTTSLCGANVMACLVFSRTRQAVLESDDDEGEECESPIEFTFPSGGGGGGGGGGTSADTSARSSRYRYPPLQTLALTLEPPPPTPTSSSRQQRDKDRESLGRFGLHIPRTRSFDSFVLRQQPPSQAVTSSSSTVDVGTPDEGVSGGSDEHRYYQAGGR